jgi:hypothetical protein
MTPLVLLLMLAALIRLPLIGNGLPLVFHEDEPIYLHRALGFGTGDLDPDYFKKPTFFLYFYFAFYYLYYLVSGAANWPEFVAAFHQNPTPVLLIGRTLTALFSIGAVGWLYAVGRRAFGAWVGIAAALLLALDFTHIKTSTNILADIPALFMILGAAWFALRVQAHGRWADYLLCAVFIALDIAFKYNFFTLAFLVTAHLLRETNPAEGSGTAGLRHSLWTRLTDRKLWVSLLTVGAVFLILCPYTVLNFSRFYEHLDHERRHMTLRTLEATERSFSPMVGFDNIFFHIFPKAIGWPLYLLGLAGLLTVGFQSLRSPSKTVKALVTLSFPLVFLLVLCQFRLVNAKYLIPILPFWYLCAGYGLSQAVVFIRSHWTQWMTPTLAAATCSLLLMLSAWPMLKDTNLFVRQYREQDTRTLARLLLDRTIRPGQQVYAEPETVPLASWHPSQEEALILEPKPPQSMNGIPRPPRASHTLVSGLSRYLPRHRSPVSLETLVKHQPQYALLLLKPIKLPSGEKRLPYPAEYYDYLKQHYHIQAVFTPYAQNGGGYTGQPVTDFETLYARLKPKKAKAQRPGPVLILLRRSN